MPYDWPQLIAAFGAGVGALYGAGKLKPEKEALAVDTLRDVVIELRTELERVRLQLVKAENLIEELTGERMPAASTLSGSEQ